MAYNIDAKTTATITNILSELSSRNRTSTGHAFGETFIPIREKTDKSKLVNNLVNITFAKDNAQALGESSVATNRGLNIGVKSRLVEDMKQELKERATNFLSGVGESYLLTTKAHGEGFSNPMSYGTVNHAYQTQQGSIQGTNSLNLENQLMFVTLAPSVILPVYNKAFKTVTVNSMYIERVQDIPYVVGANGQKYDYYTVLNNVKLMRELTENGAAQRTINIEVKMDSGKNTAKYSNLLKVYNEEGAKQDPQNFVPLTLPYDFISKGVKITGVEIEINSQTTKQTGILWESSGLATQNQQADDNVASIIFPVGKKDGTGEDIMIVGSLSADGSLYLHSSDSTDAKVKSVTFEFFIPARGAVRGITHMFRKTKLRQYISKQIVGETTLNPKVIHDNQVVLGKDLVSEFTQASVQTVGAAMDAFALTKLDEQINVAARYLANGENTFINKSAANNNITFAYRDTNMASEFYGLAISRKTGHEEILAQRMFEVCYDIDVERNPINKNYSIISNGLASRWLTQGGKSIQNFDIVGDTLNEIAGMSLPYTVKAVTIGGQYSAAYIVTNKFKPDVVSGVKTPTNRHRFYINPRFEENLDANIIVNGFEKTYQTVNHNAMYRDFSLSYEKHYDMFTFNRIIGALDFTETDGSNYGLKVVEKE